MDIQRKAFEAYMADRYKSTVDQRVCINSDGDYMAWDMQVAWNVWQAAKAQAVPEGFVSVENKLPIDGQDVIAFDAIKHCVFKGGEFLQGYIESDTGHEYEEPVEVTHWMAVEAQEPAND